MRYVRIYADEAGVSHYRDVEVDFTESDFAPPAPPLGLSVLMPAEWTGFILMPVAWAGGWHPTPRRQFMILLSGQVEVRVGDGETRRFRPGDVTLLEDTVGAGHWTTVPGDESAILAVVQLPE